MAKRSCVSEFCGSCDITQYLKDSYTHNNSDSLNTCLHTVCDLFVGTVQVRPLEEGVAEKSNIIDATVHIYSSGRLSPRPYRLYPVHAGPQHRK